MSGLKQTIRDRVKQERLELSREEVGELSHLIAEQCKSRIDWSGISSLQTFLPIKGKNEVDTFEILEFVWTEHPDIRTYAAVVSRDDIVSAPISRTTHYQEGRFGLLVPKDFEPSKSASVLPELILVPLLAFDRSCHRIGYGKGHYDRYLVHHPAAAKIGLGFESGLVEDQFFAASHDVALDAVVTETTVYHSLAASQSGIINT